MDLATLALFLPACFALNMAPGPNNLLSVSNSTRYGYRTSCLAGIGRLLAFQLWRANPEAEAQPATAKVGFWALARQEFLGGSGQAS